MIKKATEKDIPLIVEIEVNSGYKFRKKYTKKESMEKISRDFKKGKEFYVYKKIAYICIHPMENAYELEFLSVIKKYHNKGIGKLFLKFFEKYAKKKKYKKVILEVNHRNFPAIILYTKFGYYVTKSFNRINYGKKVKKLIMEKEI